MNRAGKTELKPSKGYHFSDGPYVEYIGAVPDKERDQLALDLTKHCADLIAESQEAQTRVFRKICSYDEAKDQLKAAGGVPPYCPAGRDVRVLKLIPEDLGCPCGGTHVHAISEIGRVEIIKIKKKKQNVQVSYKVIPPDGAPAAAKTSTGAKDTKKQEATAAVDLGTLEKQLQKKQYLGGNNASSADLQAYKSIDAAQLQPGAHPHTFAWFCLINSFKAEVRNAWK